MAKRKAKAKAKRSYTRRTMKPAPKIEPISVQAAEAHIRQAAAENAHPAYDRRINPPGHAERVGRALTDAGHAMKAAANEVEELRQSVRDRQRQLRFQLENLLDDLRAI